MRPLLACLILTCLVGCMPTTADQLFGIWTNLEDGFWRVLEFDDSLDAEGLDSVEPDYRIYNYDEGAEAVAIQAGWYEITREEAGFVDPLLGIGDEEDGRAHTYLVWHLVDAAGNPSDDFANEILGWSAGRLTLQSDTAEDGERVFEKADALP